MDMSPYGPQSNPRTWHWPSWEQSHERGTWGWPAVLLRWPKLRLPWHGHPGRQTLRPLHRTAPPGAEGDFSEALAVPLFIFERCPAVVVMIFISVSAPFICRFQGMLASCT